MCERPILNLNIDRITFCNYYYLKKELVDFCKQEGLQTTGGKEDLNNRIACYLETGEKIKTPSKSKCKSKIKNNEIITEDILIEPSFVCSEKHRTFFKQAIGKNFSFNVAFQKWLKENTGKMYKDAITAYYQILTEKKENITVIGKQFEYNTYIRLFFANNSGKVLKDAIKCWKYKKTLQGHNCYENSDLVALQ